VTRTVYVNGQYQPYAEASVHAEDRGFQFGDAVYEVCEVSGGRLVDETRHMQRLARSLSELRIPAPMAPGAWSRVMRETVRRNRVRDGLVYLQVSRGARPRDFLFPPEHVKPTVVCLARRVSPSRLEAAAAAGIAIKTVPDTRWARCDIKTVMLLPASLAKEAARAEYDGFPGFALHPLPLQIRAPEVVSVVEDGFARRLRVGLAPELLRYAVEKGSIGFDGVSLTVSGLGTDWVEVSLIPETLERTNLGAKLATGGRLNVECDIVAKYVERLVAPFAGKERA
jgi:hypothetical protein